jgi:nicotinate phosphoribosyltransferase
MTTHQFDIRPSIIRGDPADAYLHWTKEVMRLESLNPKVLVDFVPAREGIVCGMEEVKSLLQNVLPKQETDSGVELLDNEAEVWGLEEGDEIMPGEPVLRIIANYASFAIYETSICGILSSSSGWATAARECVKAAGDKTVIGYGARHIHPNVAHILDYASVLGGCSSASTLLGSRQSGRNPFGNMPHSLPLIFGDTVVAAQAFDRHLGMEIQRIVLVGTFGDEGEEALKVSQALRDKLRGIRIDTPSERGGVTPTMVDELRARMDQMNFKHVEIYISGGLNPTRIKEFQDLNSPVNGYLVGSYISGASPNDFTADIREIEDKAVAKRGRIPGKLDGPRLDRII